MPQFWDGDLNSNVTSALNWNGDALPGIFETVVFGNAAVAQPILGIAEVVVFAGVTVSAGRFTLGGTLHASGGVTINGTGTMSIGIAGSLTGNLTALRGLGTFTNDGTIIGNVSFNLPGTTFANGGVVSGTITFASGGVYDGRNGGAATLIGSAGLEVFIMDYSSLGTSVVVDITDGGGGRTDCRQSGGQHARRHAVGQWRRGLVDRQCGQ